MNRKETRSEYAANIAMQAAPLPRDIPVITFHPNFLKPAPKRVKPSVVKTRTGIVGAFRNLLGR